jgi:class 3 adenylate cyclase
MRHLLDTWEHLDVRSALPLIGVPTLVMCRNTDRMTPFAWSEYLADQIEGARLVDLGPGDHIFFTGDTEPILRELHDFVTGTPGGPIPEEVLATVVFTDIVGSTERAAALGDAEWHRVLERHDDLVRSELGRWRGREVKQLGDGFFAAFEGPARAIRCAQAIADGVRQFGLEIRAGVHTGECERRGDDLAGMAVHIGARVGAAAGAGEILVSSTVRDLVVGSGIEFADRGTQQLKGVPGEWRLYAVA